MELPNYPLGLTMIYNPETNETEISWSYIEGADFDHFVLEYYDDNQRKWLPYDGRNGVIKKQ